MGLWFWIGLQSAGAAECPPDPAEAVADAGQRVLHAFDRADEVSLRVAERDLDLGLGCVRVPLSSRRIAEVHRAMALIAFEKGLSAEVRRAWAAARVLDPLMEPDPARWHPTHPMWRHFEDAKAASMERTQIRRLPPGGWLVDGTPGTTAPVDRAFVLQSLGEADGGRAPVLDTAHLYSMGDLPRYDYLVLDPELRRARRKRVRTVGSVASAVMFAGAATTLALAIRDREYVVNGESYADIEKRAVRANTQASVAVGLAAGSVTTFVAAWTIKW